MKDDSKLQNLPQDTDGSHQGYPLGTTKACYGFYVYTPPGYLKKDPEYPLLLFLHGAAERGNSLNNPEDLDILLRHGPPALILKNEWDPGYPMVVASPQAHDGSWNPVKIHLFIQFIVENYNIDTSRIYITGFSMGGFGTFNYLTSTGKNCYAAAAVPVCGGGNHLKVKIMNHIPIWAFHGDDDKIVKIEHSVNMIEAINATNPRLKAKLTIYPGVGHDSWTMTYDNSGMGRESKDSDPFTISIYKWMLQFERNQLIKSHKG